MRRVMATLLIAGAVAGAGISSSAPTAGASLLNNSLFFYKTSGSPNAYRATARQGIYTSKGPSTLVKGWTSVAVSRDTMILYNKTTGKAVTGTFTGGVWKPLHHYTLRKGYDQIVATCDSVIMNGVNATYGEQGTLTGGAYSSTTITPNYGAVIFAASCDSLMLYYPSSGDTSTYVFKNGTVSNYTQYNFGSGATALVGTDDSLLVYNANNGQGAWGTFRNATYSQTGTANDFALHLTNVAGTATSIVYYQSGNPVMSLARLVNGAYTFTGTVSGVDTNWAVLAGGK